MEYSSLIKKLRLPSAFLPPTRLMYEDLLARVLTRADLHDDVRGINSSIELIQTTRGWRLADRAGAPYYSTAVIPRV